MERASDERACLGALFRGQFGCLFPVLGPPCSPAHQKRTSNSAYFYRQQSRSFKVGRCCLALSDFEEPMWSFTRVRNGLVAAAYLFEFVPPIKSENRFIGLSS